MIGEVTLVPTHHRFADLPWTCDPWRWFATTSSGSVVPLALSPGMKVDAVLRAGVIALLVPPDPDVRAAGHYLFLLDARSTAWQIHAIPVPHLFRGFDLTLSGDVLAIVSGWGKDTEFNGRQFWNCDIHLIEPSTGETRCLVSLHDGMPVGVEGEEASFLVTVHDVDHNGTLMRCFLDGGLDPFASDWDPVSVRSTRGRVKVVEDGPHERWVRLASDPHSCALPRALDRAVEPSATATAEGACASVERARGAAQLISVDRRVICALDASPRTRFAFSQSGRWLAVAGEDMITIIDARTGEPQGCWPTRGDAPGASASDALNVGNGARAVTWIGDDHVVGVYGTGLAVAQVASACATVWHGDLTWVDEVRLSDESWLVEFRGASLLRVPLSSLLEPPARP